MLRHYRKICNRKPSARLFSRNSLQNSAVLNTPDGSPVIIKESGEKVKVVKEFRIEKKFIPMTRRTLIRKLTQIDYLVPEKEKDQFIEFTKLLEHALSRSFHGVASELKQLYDPLNPDKETIILNHVGKKERLDNEFWLLEKLSDQLEKANFTEIPRNVLIKSLEEHPVYEGVHVDVDVKKYDVLRAWVLSEDKIPIETNTYYAKLKYYVNVWLLKWPKHITIYKRVVLAIRLKKQNKLLLKAFKDIPKNGMEYFLPVGKITMSKFDKSFIATTVTLGGFSFLVKVLSTLVEYQVHWTYVVGGVTSIFALKSWNAYKNKRNAYLARHSNLLYYKTIATNRALLTLIADRAEDEIFKSALVTYMIVRNENKIKELLLEDESLVKQITLSELQTIIESWFMNRYNLEVQFSPANAVQQLQQLGILKTRHIGENVHLLVLPLEEAMSHLPLPPTTEIEDYECDEVLDVESIEPENDAELFDDIEKQNQLVEEFKAPGWK